jgi:DNA-binding NarL/FixJ family response regulator
MSRARVLLADDNQQILETVTQLLAPRFDVVGAATNGESLLNAARCLNPDVLVADISMPVMNGIEVVANLKSEKIKSKVVFLTVHDDADFVTACFAVGANGYVLKSRLISDLVHAIDEALVNRTFVSPLRINAS